MLPPSLRSPGFAVFDDVLPRHDFEAVCAEVPTLTYRPARNYRASGAWRDDGRDPLEGPTLLWPSVELPPGVDLASFDVQLETYPTASARDRVLEAVKEALPLAPGLVGQELTDWIALLGTTWGYAAGDQLDWHNDAAIYSGAFVYYCHRDWPDDGGGALLMADPAKADAPRPLERLGLGHYVLPRPNRLVLIQGGVWHRVLPHSGEQLRRSVGGFFVTAQGAVELLQQLQARR